MKKKLFNIQGDTISTINTDQFSLCITWAKAFNDIYCHHAAIIGPGNLQSLFLPENAKVAVRIRLNTIEKGIIKGYSDKTIIRYLPVKYEEQSIIIALSSTELLDSLCENGWTTLKGGKRGAPKSFPLSISISLGDNDISEFYFNHEDGKFPFTICEGVLNTISDSEQIETIITLS